MRPRRALWRDDAESAQRSRDRWKAKAEWLAIHLAAADATEPLWKYADWLNAAEEATG